MGFRLASAVLGVVRSEKARRLLLCLGNSTGMQSIRLAKAGANRISCLCEPHPPAAQTSLAKPITTWDCQIFTSCLRETTIPSHLLCLIPSLPHHATTSIRVNAYHGVQPRLLPPTPTPTPTRTPTPTPRLNSNCKSTSNTDTLNHSPPRTPSMLTPLDPHRYLLRPIPFKIPRGPNRSIKDKRRQTRTTARRRSCVVR